MTSNNKNQQKHSKNEKSEPFFHSISEASWDKLMRLKMKLNHNNTQHDWYWEY